MDKNIILITGTVMTSNEESINTYEKLSTMIDNANYRVLSPLDTMKFNGSDEERYNRAMNMLNETIAMIAEMSSVSTGQGMEIQQANTLNIPILVIAKTGSKISGLVKGCKNVKNIIYYNDVSDIKKEIIEFIESMI